MSHPDPDVLLTALRDAARSLTARRGIRDVETTLSELVRAAVDTVPHADGGGISRTDRGTVRSSNATSEDVRRLDELQSELGQGPCVTAADDPPAAGLVLAHDLAGDDARRWPSFAPAAVRAGYRSLMAVPLSLTGRYRCALNLYARTPGVFDVSAQLTAGMFGIQAAMLLHGADHAANLDHALATRDVIGQAKGILMERFGIPDDQAFHLLVTSSQETNVKLIDIARWLTGAAPVPAPDRGVRATEPAVTGDGAPQAEHDGR